MDRNSEAFRHKSRAARRRITRFLVHHRFLAMSVVDKQDEQTGTSQAGAWGPMGDYQPPAISLAVSERSAGMRNAYIDRLEAVRTMGFERMTPVQASTIPRAVKNQDCVVEVCLRLSGPRRTLMRW